MGDPGILFHVKPYWERAARFSGIDPNTRQTEQMEMFAGWLATEASIAGGIGPDEIDRIDRRHLADSVLFLSEIPQYVQQVWDLGSGVGLPGIPIAILLPDAEVTLIDRSGRRVDLMKRVIRILALENCQVIQGDIQRLTGETEAIVSRASLAPDRLGSVVKPLLARGGRAVVAGSWEDPPHLSDWEVVEIPPEVLDHTIWLLIMRRE